MLKVRKFHQSTRSRFGTLCPPPILNRVKVKFSEEKVIVERWEMAHSVCVEKLFHIKPLKSFVFLLVTNLNERQKLPSRNDIDQSI